MTVAGVVVPGDVIDDGCQLQPKNLTADPGCSAELSNYTTRFPVHGQLHSSNASSSSSSSSSWSSTTLRYPTFEGVGNHDGGNSTEANGLVRRELIGRNRQRASRPGLAPPKYRLSPNGLHYAWAWEGVHFIMLGVYPGTNGDCASGQGVPGTGCDGTHPPYGWHSPSERLRIPSASFQLRISCSAGFQERT